jgi:ABC-type sugar transport system ATPase subunit
MKPLLDAVGLRKSYSGITVLRDVDLRINAGEVHGLLGANGAGKSTLIGLLEGAIPADSGEVRVAGKAVDLGSVAASRAAGIVVVHQELALLGSRTVEENICATSLPRRGRVFVDRSQRRRRARAALAEVGAHVDLGARVDSLSVAEQQLIELARAILTGGQVLVLDEPTSALSAADCSRLMLIVKQLARNGRAVLFVSHHLQEVAELCDRITVLRDGMRVHEGPNAPDVFAPVISLITGEEQLREVLAEPESPVPGSDADRAHRADENAAALPLLDVRSLTAGRLGPISFELRAGEILGIAGLSSSGADNILRVLSGADRGTGSVTVEGNPLRLNRIRSSINHGIAYLPTDRKTEGLWLSKSVSWNIASAALAKVTKFGIIDRGRMAALARRRAAELDVRLRDVSQVVDQLSGGNQQKVLLARCLVSEPRIILMSNPTRGVDVGAKAAIHQEMRRISAAGVGICMTSAEVEEVVEMSDRIICVFNGRVVCEISRPDASYNLVLAAISGDAAA